MMFMKNLSIAGGFLALSVAGAGGFSLDALLKKRLLAAKTLSRA